MQKQDNLYNTLFYYDMQYINRKLIGCQSNIIKYYVL